MHKVFEGWIIDVIPNLHLSIWVRGEFSLVGLIINFSNFNLIVEEQVGNSHSILSEGTSLVRANAGCRSQSFDRFEVFNQDEFLSHSLCSKSKRYSDGSEESFWDVGDNNPDGKY